MRMIERTIAVGILILFILFFILGCTTSKTLTAPEQTDSQVIRLRILSYNIHYGRGVHKLPNLKRIARVIRSTHPDIVSLQEVDQRRARSWYVDQVKKLAHLTHLVAIFKPNAIYKNGGTFGNVVLTRFPVIWYKNHPLPPVSAGNQRGVLEVELAIRDDFHLRFFATHLKAGKGYEAERIASANIIETIVQSNVETPMILAGDLNAKPQTTTMSIFRRMWKIAGDGKGFLTRPSISPERWIDYILFRPQSQWKVIEVKVIPERIASDHLPLLVVLEWIGE